MLDEYGKSTPHPLWFKIGKAWDYQKGDFRIYQLEFNTSETSYERNEKQLRETKIDNKKFKFVTIGSYPYPPYIKIYLASEELQEIINAINWIKNNYSILPITIQIVKNIDAVVNEFKVLLL